MLQRGNAPWPVRLRRLFAILPLLLVAAVATPHGATAQSRRPSTYTNPLPIQIPGDGMVESCADPVVFRAVEADDEYAGYWYMYCTTDPLNDEDRNATNTDFNFHKVPMMRSYDLVNWTYIGDAFTTNPTWA